MKRKSLFILGLIISFFSGFSQIPYVKTIIKTGIYNYHISELIITSNEVVAITQEPGSKIFDLRKFDFNGNMLLKKSYKLYSDSLSLLCGITPNNYTSFFEMKIHYDQGDSTYFVLGRCSQNYGSCNQLNTSILFKLNNDLDTLWSREYSAFPTNSIFDYNDSSLYVLGNSYLLKLNSETGDTIWCRTTNITSTNNDFIKGIDDTTVVICGSGGTLFKINYNKNIQWSKQFYDNFNHSFLKMDKTTDNNYIIAGMRTNGITFQYATLVKVDLNGNVIWAKNYYLAGKKLQPRSLVSTNDGGFLMTLQINDSITSSLYPSTLLKLNSSGEIIWNKVFLGTQYTCVSTYLNKIIQLSNSGYIITGGHLIKTDSIGNNCFFIDQNNIIESDISLLSNSLNFNLNSIPNNWFWKYNLKINKFIYINNNDNTYHDICSVTTQITETNALNELVVFPNPSSGKLNITFPKMENGELKIYNSTGALILEKAFIKSEKLEVNLDSKTIGFYLIIVTDGTKNYIKKLILK